MSIRYGKVSKLVIMNPNIPMVSKAIYAELATFADKETGIAFPSRRTMTTVLGIGKDYYTKGLRALKDEGLINTFQVGKDWDKRQKRYGCNYFSVIRFPEAYLKRCQGNRKEYNGFVESDKCGEAASRALTQHDLYQGGYCMVPSSVMEATDIGLMEKVVYLYLLTKADKNGVADYVTKAWIAASLNLSQNTVSKSLGMLQKFNYITTSQKWIYGRHVGTVVTALRIVNDLDDGDMVGSIGNYGEDKNAYEKGTVEKSIARTDTMRTDTLKTDTARTDTVKADTKHNQFKTDTAINRYSNHHRVHTHRRKDEDRQKIETACYVRNITADWGNLELSAPGANEIVKIAQEQLTYVLQGGYLDACNKYTAEQIKKRVCELVQDGKEGQYLDIDIAELATRISAQKNVHSPKPYIRTALVNALFDPTRCICGNKDQKQDLGYGLVDMALLKTMVDRV